jgi:hypothetical protein
MQWRKIFLELIAPLPNLHDGFATSLTVPKGSSEGKENYQLHGSLHHGSL